MIALKQLGRIALMTMTHGKANALDIALCQEIVRRFDEVGDSAVILTGEGRIFSAGVDLVRATAGGADYLREFLPVLSQAFAAVFFHPAPVVAAINGHAVAAGCVLVAHNALQQPLFHRGEFAAARRHRQGPHRRQPMSEPASK